VTDISEHQKDLPQVEVYLSQDRSGSIGLYQNRQQ